MTRRQFLAAGMAFVLLQARASEDTLDQLPPWNYSELVQAATEGLASGEVKDVRLLAWHTQEDGRPIRFDAALMWLHIERQDTGEQWILLKLGRNPTEEGARREWGLTFEGHQWSPVKLFDNPPRNRDVYTFLKDHWEFNPDGRTVPSMRLSDDGKWIPSRYTRFRILRAGVRSKTWRSVIGDDPTQFHRGERRR